MLTPATTHAHACYLCWSDCNNRWSRNSFSDIAWFLVASFFAFLFSSFAWAYLHQLLAVGTLLDVGPGRGPGADHISLQTYPPRYDPPSYPPPRESTEDAHSTGGKAPEYDGYNAGNYVVKEEKAPAYDAEESGIQKGHSRTQEEEGEDGEGHGPRVQDSNNPFRKSP